VSATPQLAESGTGLLRATWVARLEAPLAVGALIVLAIHVLDDNFLQPQPGTSAGDHLASGLVPLAVLVGCAATYSRLRPGLRAMLAIALGLFGIVAGLGEAGYYSLHGGPSGDDYTARDSGRPRARRRRHRNAVEDETSRRQSPSPVSTA